MPGGFPIGLELCNGSNAGAVTANNLGTAITTPSTAHTKSAYTQLVASTPSDVSYLVLNVAFVNFDNSTALAIDIAIGASGSEVVLVENIVIGSAYNVVGGNIPLPIQIPAGSRISARAQCGVASLTFTVEMILFDGSFNGSEGYAGVEALGFSATATTGVAMTPNSSSSSKGAWSQIISATARDYAGIMVAIDPHGGGNNQNYNYLIDIGIGASGSEIVVIPNLYYKPAGPVGGLPFFIPLPVVAGTRISARCSAPFNDQTPGCTIYGVF